MSESEHFMFPSTDPQVTYRSFVLRLRQVNEEGENRQQFFLKDIQTREEFYFVDLQGMMRFLQAYLSNSTEDTD